MLSPVYFQSHEKLPIRLVNLYKVKRMQKELRKTVSKKQRLLDSLTWLTFTRLVIHKLIKIF